MKEQEVLDVQRPSWIKEILSWYPAMTPGQRNNLGAILNFGRIRGSGKAVILPVDQGWEHGPGRSFLPNPAGFNPCYHAQLALASGCNAYAAPLGALEAAADILAASRLPTILKLNSHELMMPDKEDYFPAVTASVKDAVRLKCAAIGFTIYPGSAYAREMYEQVRELATQARYHDLVVVVWAYPRGTGLPTVDDVKTDLELKDKLTPEADKEVKKSNIEIAVDVVCYAVHIAAQLGAHIIKCKPTSRLVALPDHIIRGTYDDIPINTLAERTRLVIQSAFAG